MRAGWAVPLLVVLLWAVPALQGPARAEARLASPGEPVRVSSGPQGHTSLTIAVDRHGQATVAWVQRLPGDNAGPPAAEIRLASAPEWAPVTVARPAAMDPERPAGAPRLVLVAGEAIHLAWTEAATPTMRAWRYTHDDGRDPVLAWEEEVPYTPVLAAGPAGALHALWADAGGLVLIHETATHRSSLTLDIAVLPTELDLVIDASGRPHAAWAGRRQLDQGPGIYYAALDADASATEIDASGRAPRLAAGPLGAIHLCWRRPEGLHCADSRDWGRVSAVAPDLPEEQVAMAVGPGDVAHVAWSEDGALWYANSGDWAASRRLLANLDADYLSMAVDRAGRPHLAATVGTEDGGSTLYVLVPFSVEPQLAVVAPTAGAWLAPQDPLMAVTNLPAAEWQRVLFYLQPAAPGTDVEDALILIGTDDDGRDGWSVPFVAQVVDTGIPHRVVAVGVDVRGGVTSAMSEPVMVRPSGGIPVWVVNPGPDVVRGMGEALVLMPGAEANVTRLEVSLTEFGCPMRPRPDEAICSIPSRTYLVASLDVEPSIARPEGEWFSLTYDSRGLPDGDYRLSAVAIDRDGGEHSGVGQGSLTIDNTLAPSVRVTEPRPGATVWGAFRVAAEAEGRAAAIQRVDFYAGRQRTLLHRAHGPVRHTVETPDVVWLGSDHDGSDGWSIRVTAGPLLDGDDWLVHAVAYDDRGGWSTAHSGDTLAIVGRERPASRFTLPAPDSTVSGVVPVVVRAMVGSRHANAVALYAETPGQRLVPLGAMAERGGRWALDWNTADLPDGDYDLVAVVRHVDGRASMVRSGAARVRNTWGGYRFASPEEGEPLRGAQVLRVIGADGAAQVSRVWLYYRDLAGQLRAIGSAIATSEGWTLVWDTAGVLDGAYDLVAVIHGVGGGARVVERPIVIENDPAPHQIVWPAPGEVIGGTQRLAWRMDSRARVALAWSPDGGVHWLGLAEGREGIGSLDWNTSRLPDTPRAMLRLTAGDGARRTVVETGPFTIDNTNAAPRVNILAPWPGEAHGATVFVAWRAWDPDGDAVVVDLDYRRGLGAWQPLARGVAASHHALDSASYTWDTSRLEPGADYVLRVTARDPSRATASDQVAGQTLLANRPPTVRLVTPDAGALLRTDAVILWQAEDPDDDALRIDLYYSDNAGQTWLPIAEGMPNTGYYMWQVSFLPMGSRYRVRVVARDGFFTASDDSDGTIVVGGTLPPTLALLQPAAGSRVAGVVPVRWDSGMRTTEGLTVTVAMRSPGDVVWRPLLEDAPDDGFFSWDTTALPDGAHELRVTVSDGRDDAATIVPVTVANHRNERPEVLLLAPVGGEIWRGAREIVWRAWDNDGDPLTATVSLSHDGGATWRELATVDARQGRMLWDTAAWRDVRALLVRAVVSDGQATARATTAAPVVVANGAGGASPRFLSPDGEGILWRNDIITWEAGVAAGAPARVSLALRRDDAAGPAAAGGWQVVTDGAYDAGEAVVPEGWLKPGHAHRLRVIVDDGALRVAAISPPVEVIRAGSEPPTVTLEQPAGGEVWSQEREIRWQAGTPDDRVLRATIELSRDGGASWVELSRDTANVGRHPWDTTTVANGAYRLRLTVGDDRAETTIISRPFEVQNPGRNAPVLSLTAPRAGEVWAGTREIQWRATSPDGRALAITLAYSLDGGGTWRRFAYNVAASEGYLWDTTIVPNCEVLWLRATVSDGLLVAEDYAGPFAVRNARAPVVALLEPLGGEQWAGEQRIAWYTVHEAGRTVRAMLQLSVDRGRTWQTIAHDLPDQGAYRWDTSAVPDYASVLLRAYVSDGHQNAVSATRAPVRVRHLPVRPETPFFLP